MKIVIVGGGIIGLTTGLYLKKTFKDLDDVTIVTDKITPNTTADGAAGIWGIYLLTDTPIEQQKRWAKETHDFIQSLWQTENGGLMGITLVNVTRLNYNPDLIHIWNDIVYGFRKLTDKELSKYGRLHGKHTHGYGFMTYTIEPIKLMPWFLNEFKELGGKIVSGVKVTDLGKVANEYNADLVINCTGVWASELTRDSKIAPLRGQVMRVEAPWIREVIMDDTDDGNYIIPNQDSVVLGGTHQHNDWNTNPYDEDREFIWKGCKALLPFALNDAKFLKDWVGLRPGRDSVRLERDQVKFDGKTFNIIHNYGHGGSGITIFWGCAKEVFDLVVELKAENHELIETSKL